MQTESTSLPGLIESWSQPRISVATWRLVYIFRSIQSSLRHMLLSIWRDRRIPGRDGKPHIGKWGSRTGERIWWRRASKQPTPHRRG